MPRTAIEQRVACGAAFMDRERPNWEQDVNLSILNLGDNESCILGQYYSEYGLGTVVLGLSMRRQYRYGFIATKEGGCAEYPDLTEAWANEIVARLKKTMSAKNIANPKQSAARLTQASLS